MPVTLEPGAPRPMPSSSLAMIRLFVIVEAADLDGATELAEACPLLEFGMTVEVRPVAGACHLAIALGWETMREPVPS